MVLMTPVIRLDSRLFSMPKPFGEWLAEMIDRRGTSQNQVAKKIGKSPAHVSNIISGGRGVSADVLRALAYALEVPPGEVFRVWAEAESGEAMNIISEGNHLPSEMIEQLTEMILRLPPEDWEDALEHLDVITRGLKAARSDPENRPQPSEKH